MTSPTEGTGRLCVPRPIHLIVIASLMLLCPSARGAVTFTNQEVTAQTPPAAGCVVPPSKSSYLTTDGTVYLYFEATVASSDAMTNDWLAPDGTSVAPASWNSSSGDFCFTGASLSISSLSAGQLGVWQARVFDNGNLLFSIPFTVSAPAGSGASYYLPQLAFGGGYQTTLTYVNYSAQSVTCQTTFYSDAGGSLQVPFSGGPLSQRTDNLAAGADIHVQTNAAAGSQVAQGWAQVQCGAPVKASLLYRFYSGSVPQGEASVNATTTPTTEFVTFAQTQTGFAYANPSATAATVTVTALDSSGKLLGTTSFPLAPNAHGAANIGPLLGLSSFTGSIQITSTVPIVSLSLNAEAFPVFSSLPPGDLPSGTALATGKAGGASTNGTFSYYFPQLAFGGGYQTTLTYVNYSAQSVTCQTTFYSDASGSLQVPFSGGPLSQRTDNLAAGADIHVQTNAAAGSQVAQGWAQVQCSAPVKAGLLYRFYSGSVPQGEASVNATTTPTTEFVTFAQNQTGLAYANPSATAATVTVTALDSSGNLLGTTSFPLAPNAHGAANIGPLLGLSSFTGSIQITSTVPIVSLSLNAEAFPVFSSLPPGDLPSGTPLATGNGGPGGTGLPVIMSFTASPSSIQAGQSDTLSWSVQNANSLSINNGIGTVSGSSISVTPSATTTYTLTASNANGSTSASVTVTVNTGGGPSGPISITSISSTSPLPLNPLYIKTTGVSINAPVSVTFSNSSGYSVTTGAIRVDSTGMVVAAVPIYVVAGGVPSAGTVFLTISQGTTQSTAATINIQNLPSVQSYGMAPGQISHAFIVYEEMGIARRINELQAFQALPGNTVDMSQEISQLQKMLLAVIESRNDADRVAQSASTVISAGTMAGGTTLQFDSSSLDMMDRVLGAYLTQMQPYLAAPPPNVVSAGRRRQQSPVLGLAKYGLVRGKVARPGPRHRVVRAQPRLSSASGSMKQLTDYLTYAANGSGIAATLQSYATSDKNFLDKISSVTGGLSGVLGLYALKGLSPAQAFPVNIAAAGLGAISGGAALLNDLGHELGALAFVVTASDNTDPSVINDAWQEIADKNLHVVIDAAQTDLSLFSYGINSAGLPLFSAALNNFGLEAATVFQASAESGVINTGFQGASLFTNLASYYADHGFDSLANFGAQLYNEASAGTIKVADAFGDLVGSVDITTDLGIAAPLSGIDLSSDLPDSFNALADPNGNYILTLPIGDPDFDYSNADLEVVDPVSNDELGDVTVNLSSLSSQSAFDVPTVSGSCTDDDAGDPDADDPDCD